MSSTLTKNISCPVCGTQNEITVYKTVNANTDPDLRTALLNGELLHFKCMDCGYEAELKYPLLYNDVKNAFMIYYLPDIDRETITDEDLEKQFPDLDDITRRLVSSFNELKEKIHIFESGLDDEVIEVVKAALKDVVEKRTNDTVEGGFFSKYSTSEDRIGFTFFVGEDKEQFVQTTRLEVYEKSTPVAKSFDAPNAHRHFRTINRDWARNAIYNYRKNK